MATFTVDTHLFRELGELLVGRDSTALIELIKNSYDADATEVIVHGEMISNAERGYIQIRDNGIGMSRSEFETGFLRIASRTKEAGDRRSLVYRRRYTGAKGVGRLAAHKLARHLEVHSSRWNGKRPDSASSSLAASGDALVASIDWARIEEHKTLDEIDGTDAILIKDLSQRTGASAGTTVILRRLRRSWTSAAHGRFLDEVQAFAPPGALVNSIPRTVLGSKLLFDVPTVRDVSGPSGSKFVVRLEGDLAPPDDYWIAIAEAADWIIEIDADRRSGKVRYAIAPSKSTRVDNPDAELRQFEVDHPSPHDGPFFQARILKRVGRATGSEKEWATRVNGVRVFLEGFRILPYGESRNDWLSLDRDTTQRDRGVLNRTLDRQLQGQFSEGEISSARGAGLIHLPNKHYVGAVFITERNAPRLRLLVNREGFVPDENYDTLVDLVRKGIDLSTRVQAAATESIRTARRELRAKGRIAATNESGAMPTALVIQDGLRTAQEQAQQARRLVASGSINEAVEMIGSALDEVESISAVSSELVEESAMIRVLASVGTQLASFVHEINGLLGIASAVDAALQALRREQGLPPKHKRGLAQLHQSLGDLKRALERQASYLVDVVAPDARRRRSRQSLAACFEASEKLVQFAAERRFIKLENRIPRELRTPPMFRAEIVTIFSNLLTNAIKAAGKRKGRIVATGRQSRDGTILVRVENTGVRISLKSAERWFRPFESSTTDVDPVLGQGMGLGLPITRSILDEYGATIRFVEPKAGFSTAIEICFPDS